MWNDFRRLKALLAGDRFELDSCVLKPGRGEIRACFSMALFSCALYGFTFGLWRSELQAVSTAIKFPLVIVFTCGANALLNGMLAQILGTGLSFRQSAMAILVSFTITGIILAAFAPLMLFLLCNVPSLGEAHPGTGHRITLLAHVVVIAFGGIMGNRRLWQFLRRSTGSSARASGVLFSWLAGNLLLGSQVSWIFRPWAGTPPRPGLAAMELPFLTPHPLQGNFFESVWWVVTHLHR